MYDIEEYLNKIYVSSDVFEKVQNSPKSGENRFGSFQVAEMKHFPENSVYCAKPEVVREYYQKQGEKVKELQKTLEFKRENVKEKNLTDSINKDADSM